MKEGVESCCSGLKVDLVNFTFKRSNTNIQVDELGVNSLFYRKKYLKTVTTLGTTAFIFVYKSLSILFLTRTWERESDIQNLGHCKAVTLPLSSSSLSGLPWAPQTCQPSETLFPPLLISVTLPIPCPIPAVCRADSFLFLSLQYKCHLF